MLVSMVFYVSFIDINIYNTSANLLTCHAHCKEREGEGESFLNVKFNGLSYQAS
jgi:hypothetical protein